MEVGVVPVGAELSVRHPRARRAALPSGTAGSGEMCGRFGAVSSAVPSTSCFTAGFLLQTPPMSPGALPPPRPLRAHAICGADSSIGRRPIAPPGAAHARGVSGPSVDTSLADQRRRPVDARAIANEPHAPIPRGFPFGRMATLRFRRPCVRRFDKSDAHDNLDWGFLSPADCFSGNSRGRSRTLGYSNFR